MKVFVIAFACEPDRTSEPGVGWNIVGELAKKHELTVLTRSNNRSVIEEYVRRHEGTSWARIRWEYFELAEWFHQLKKRIPCGIQLYQELWQWRAAKKYRQAFARYDIVHHLTFGSIFFTPWAARYSDRLVWGPIGGASGAMEAAFLKSESWRSRVSETLYRLVAWYSYHPAPWARTCRRKCRAILFRISELAKNVVMAEGQETTVIGETAYAGEVAPRTYDTAPHPLRIMSVGRLIPLKGVRYTIEAFAEFLKNGGAGVLDIYGTGLLKGSLANLAAKLGVSERVCFHGNVPNAQVLEALDRADVLVHSSFREGGSWTILEAMAHGVPVVCQDRAGMKDMVTDDCGVRISARNPEDLKSGIASALRAYYDNPGRIQAQGHAAQRRIAEHYRWGAIADAIDMVYGRVP